MSEKKEYIERGAALETLKEVVCAELASDTDNNRANYIIGAIELIPAADADPVVREECEHCSTKVHTTDDGQPFSQEWYLTVNGCRFCPQCGRKLNMERSGSGE